MKQLAIHSHQLTMPRRNPALSMPAPQQLGMQTQDGLEIEKNHHQQTLSFKSLMNVKIRPQVDTDKLDPKTQAKLKEVTSQFLSAALYLPLMKQMRENPFKTELFHGGMGEDMFNKQMDQQMADRLASSSSGQLGESIYKRFAEIVSLHQNDTANTKPSTTKKVNTVG